MLKWIKRIVIVAVMAAVSLLVGRWLWPLPDISGRAVESALPVSADTRLGRYMLTAAAEHPGLTGVLPLADGRDALASRLALIERAEHSIDSQYYIWHDDSSGILLLDALERAAARGVRVRLLLDDNGIDGLDGYLAALNAGANFHIRLFNPSTVRKPKLLGFAFDFLRMNRRMHNKSLIVDGAVTIIGGRNIGDEYFEIGETYFKDMDVLATGTIVADTSRVFDAYWNSGSVFALESLVKGAGDAAGLAARNAAVKADDQTRVLLHEMQSTATRYAEQDALLEWTRVHLVADDPIKGQGKARRDQLMAMRLAEILGTVERRMDVVSAYFIPGKEGVAYFSNLARAGKQVRVLTNALNTTDVVAVHAGYAKYRRALLESGVSLYEMKLRGSSTAADQQMKPFGLSGASLHAKTFAIDDERVFIGSFNFDPRSVMLNCEMGFLIESPTMAKRVTDVFDHQIEYISYRPELTPDGHMVWQETLADGKRHTYQQEPDTSGFQQVMLAIIGVLPVEWLL